MKEVLSIKNNPTLVREIHSKSIVNTDKAGLVRAQKQKESFVSLRKKSEEMETEIGTLKSQFQELNVLVKNFVNRPATV